MEYLKCENTNKQTKTLNGIKIRLATVKDKVGDLKDIKI